MTEGPLCDLVRGLLTPRGHIEIHNYPSQPVLVDLPDPTGCAIFIFSSLRARQKKKDPEVKDERDYEEIEHGGSPYGRGRSISSIPNSLAICNR